MYYKLLLQERNLKRRILRKARKYFRVERKYDKESRDISYVCYSQSVKSDPIVIVKFYYSGDIAINNMCLRADMFRELFAEYEAHGAELYQPNAHLLIEH